MQGNQTDPCPFRLGTKFHPKIFGNFPQRGLAESLKSLFCPGMKVAIECAIMALDGGTIPLDKTIAVGGTGAKGGGADTAIVVLPSHTNIFLISKYWR